MTPTESGISPEDHPVDTVDSQAIEDTLTLTLRAGAAPESVDGRSERRDRNRVAVLDAVVELFAEGDLNPSPEAVARRAGLSRRSVYRYFEDGEALYRAAIARNLERSLPLFRISAIGQGSLEERISRFVEGRLRLHTSFSAAARASRMRAVTNELVREQVEFLRRALRAQVEKHFAPEFASLDPRQRRARIGAIDVLCELESLDHLRIHRGLSASETQVLLTDALHLLLAN